ncbi:Persistence and stress-resistance antitoxin PasI [Halomonas sp. THAF12]|uniref:RnfH family protein n=1 Tax=Halomonas sp. THAF12 TaxID=2587849 RepID=UPI001268E01B|nr:RnfH family protein [Halomonas sp. THAF12]QFT86557.1 Persistence and stress-resistance antitoxin PasI [Halomonas sp. THAF12]
MLRVEVAFALPQRQRIVELTVPEGTTAREAVARAGLEALFPEVSAETFREADLGIFGKALRDPEARVLEEGDRVEVYRPLELDPKAARAARAARASRSS